MQLSKQVVLHFLMLFVIIFLVACQPNPTSTAYNKLAHIDTPNDTYSAEVDLTDGIRLNFHSELSVLNSPIIYGAFKAVEYSDELVQQVYTALCSTAQPCQYCSTAQDLYSYVAYGKESLELLKATLPEEIIEQEQNELNSLLKEAQNAPDERAVADLSQITEYKQGLIMVNMGGDTAAQFQVLTSPRYNIYYSNYQLPAVNNEPCPEPLKMSQGDAVSIVNDILQKIGIENDFTLVRTQEEVVNYAFYQIYFDDSTKNKAYTLLYLRRVNNTSQLDDSRVLLGTDNQYDLSFLQEYILFKIDDNGILSFEWNTPGELEMAEEPQSVITFDDAVSVATSQMKVSFTKYTFEGADPENIMVCINKIALGYIFCEGTGNTVDVVPAWEFFGYIVDESKPEGADRFYDVNTKNWTASYEDNVSLCVINALDGNVIDRIGKY